MPGDKEYNERGTLSPAQISLLKKQTVPRIFVFAFVFILAPAWIYLIYLFSTNSPPEGHRWLLIFQVLLVIFMAILAYGSLGCGWLALANIVHYFRIQKIKVQHFDDFPYKKLTRWRPPLRMPYAGFSLLSPKTFTIGAGLVSKGKSYGVPVRLMGEIPDLGLCRFYHIKRPGFPLVLMPREVIDFELLDEKAPFPWVEALLEGAAENAKGKLSSEQIEMLRGRIKKDIKLSFLPPVLMLAFSCIFLISLIWKTPEELVWSVLMALVAALGLLLAVLFSSSIPRLIKFHKNLSRAPVESFEYTGAKSAVASGKDIDIVSNEGIVFKINPLILERIPEGRRCRLYYISRPGMPIVSPKIEEVIGFGHY
jgi:hypothetical protein